MKNNGTLIKGRIYQYDQLRCVGWTDGDGSGHRGYDWRDYFRGDQDDGEYLGADECGIEPKFDPIESSYSIEDLENDLS